MFGNRREEWSVTLVPVKSATPASLSAAARRVFQAIPPEPVSRDLGVDGKGYDGG